MNDDFATKLAASFIHSFFLSFSSPYFTITISPKVLLNPISFLLPLIYRLQLIISHSAVPSSLCSNQSNLNFCYEVLPTQGYPIARQHSYFLSKRVNKSSQQTRQYLWAQSAKFLSYSLNLLKRELRMYQDIPLPNWNRFLMTSWKLDRFRRTREFKTQL